MQQRFLQWVAIWQRPNPRNSCFIGVEPNKIPEHILLVTIAFQECLDFVIGPQ